MQNWMSEAEANSTLPTCYMPLCQSVLAYEDRIADLGEI